MTVFTFVYYLFLIFKCEIPITICGKMYTIKKQKLQRETNDKMPAVIITIKQLS